MDMRKNVDRGNENEKAEVVMESEDEIQKRKEKEEMQKKSRKSEKIYKEYRA